MIAVRVFLCTYLLAGSPSYLDPYSRRSAPEDSHTGARASAGRSTVEAPPTARRKARQGGGGQAYGGNVRTRGFARPSYARGGTPKGEERFYSLYREWGNPNLSLRSLQDAPKVAAPAILHAISHPPQRAAGRIRAGAAHRQPQLSLIPCCAKASQHAGEQGKEA